jgi:hypothetical protein
VGEEGWPMDRDELVECHLVSFTGGVEQHRFAAGHCRSPFVSLAITLVHDPIPEIVAEVHRGATHFPTRAC